jgi:hypothetical protein
VTPNKRLQEKIERDKSWMFMTLEDLEKSPTLEEFLKVPEYGPDGQEKKKTSAVDRFYESLGRRDALDKKTGASAKEEALGASRPGETRSGSEPSEESALSEKPKEDDTGLRKALGLESEKSDSATTPVRSRLTDIFGLGNPNLPVTPAPNPYVQQYRELLHGPAVPSVNSLAPLSGGGNPEPPRPVYHSGVEAYTPSSRPQTSELPGGTLKPVLPPSAPADYSRQVLNQWNPLYTPPKVETKRVSPPAPNFTGAQRKF